MAVRIGVVGAGALGFHHTRILRDVPGAQLIGFHEAKTERAEYVSTELGVKAFPTLESLLDVVDAVSVVVPTPAHYAVAAPALERGLHVLIEKPIATTLDEADGLLAIARRTGAVVQTGHVERFNRAVRAGLRVCRGAAVHREQSSRAVQPARLGRCRRARPDDP